MLISTRVPASNPELQDLFWDSSKYIDGYTDKPGNAGLLNIYEPGNRVAEFGEAARSCENPIVGIAQIHGIHCIYKRPFIPYTPKLIPELKDVMLASPFSNTTPIPASTFHRFCEYVGRDHKFGVENVVNLVTAYQPKYGNDALTGAKRFHAETLRDWIDAIYSCKLFLTTEAFGQTVGAALRLRGTTYSIQTDKSFNEGLFIFPGVRYKTTGFMNDDFHSKGYPA